MAAFSPPVSHADTEGTLGYSAVFASAEMEMALTEALDAESLGLITGVGDLAGSGSDTLNLTYFDGLGWAEEFTAMSTETEEIPVSGYTGVNDTVTIGRYGLAKSETYTRKILGRIPGVILDQLMTRVPDSLARTIMTQLTTAFQSVSGSAGTSGSAWSFDAELDMLATLRETEGFQGMAHRVGHPEMFTDLYESLRNEPSYQSAAVMDRLLTLANQGAATEPLWGVRNVSSHRVTQSGGDHVGCAYAPGAFVLARASTQALANENPGAELIVPRLGLYIVKKTVGAEANSRFDANAWLGVAQRATAVAPAVRCLSVDD